MKLWLVGALVALNLAACWPAQAQEESACGSLANGYGPFDYRKERSRALRIVEEHHFNSDVQQLRKGQEGYLGGDLDYVLRASPNHHRALAVISEWGVRTKTNQPPGLPRSIDCYFERATRFQSDDHIARMLYASYLQRSNQRAEALRVLEPLEKLDDLDPYTNQNLGLLLLDLNEPERALAQAWKASAQGWTRPGLKERLQAAGQWREPTPPDAAASAPPPAASAASAP
jgi:hypothetical protein